MGTEFQIKWKAKFNLEESHIKPVIMFQLPNVLEKEKEKEIQINNILLCCIF